MRRLVFATQKLDPGRPGARGDRADGPRARGARRRARRALRPRRRRASLPANCRVHEFGARDAGSSAARASSAALARELRAAAARRRRAHGAALRRARRAARAAARHPARALVHALEGARRRPRRRAALDRDRLGRPPLVPARARGRCARSGTASTSTSSPCTDAPAGEQLRALVLGRYSPAKGLETILARRGARGRRASRCTAPTRPFEEHKREPRALARELGVDAELGGPVPRAEVPALFARSHVLVNNMRAGAPDKVVYEAAATCLPVLASNPVFDDLLPAGAALRARRPREPRRRAARARARPPRARPRAARAASRRNHSVEHWADARARYG